MTPMRRIAAGLFLAAVVSSCDPVATGGIAVAPSPKLNFDSASTIALEVFSRVAGSEGLSPLRAEAIDPEGFAACFGKGGYWICGKAHAGEVQFVANQWGKFHFTKRAAAINRAMADSLAQRFGAGSVRLCRWKIPRDAKNSGCDLARNSDSP